MKGFLSFALVLAMISCLLWISIANEQNGFELEKTKNELIIAEMANKERTLLENNFDKIVRAKLAEQILAQNFNVKIAQNEINTKLAEYLKGKASACNLANEKGAEAGKEYLNENTSVVILQAQGAVYAEYAYTSGMMKNTTVCAKFGNKIVSYFEVPIGYTYRGLWPA